jgi:hypothetical protein
MSWNLHQSRSTLYLRYQNDIYTMNRHLDATTRAFLHRLVLDEGIVMRSLGQYHAFVILTQDRVYWGKPNTPNSAASSTSVMSCGLSGHTLVCT